MLQRLDLVLINNICCLLEAWIAPSSSGRSPATTIKKNKPNKKRQNKERKWKNRDNKDSRGNRGNRENKMPNKSMIFQSLRVRQ